jgi:hypothetical protein
LLDFIFITSPWLDQVEFEIARRREKVRWEKDRDWTCEKVSPPRFKIPRGDDNWKANKTPSIICHDKLNRRVQTAFPNLYHTSSVETNTFSFTKMAAGIQGKSGELQLQRIRIVLMLLTSTRVDFCVSSCPIDFSISVICD